MNIRKGKKDNHDNMKHTKKNTDKPEESTDMENLKPERDGLPVTAPDHANQDIINELNDKYLRLYSEFDNYRKRTLKEKSELSRTASADLITRLLPVLDDFDRAIKAFDSSPDTAQALKEGVILIFNKFFSILSQQGLVQMKTIGEAFDTDFHEAITNIPAPREDQKGKVVDEIEKGYLLSDKVIRYAKVVVGI
jgi:molecular chaperone GrpE